jgi:hypothetical protein
MSGMACPTCGMYVSRMSPHECVASPPAPREPSELALVVSEFLAYCHTVKRLDGDVVRRFAAKLGEAATVDGVSGPAATTYEVKFKCPACAAPLGQWIGGQLLSHPHLAGPAPRVPAGAALEAAEHLVKQWRVRAECVRDEQAMLLDNEAGARQHAALGREARALLVCAADLESALSGSAPPRETRL